MRHEGSETRVTLMLDFWQPNLSPVEIEAMQLLMQAGTSSINADQFFHSLGMLSSLSRGASAAKVAKKKLTEQQQQ